MSGKANEGDPLFTYSKPSASSRNGQYIPELTASSWHGYHRLSVYYRISGAKDTGASVALDKATDLKR